MKYQDLLPRKKRPIVLIGAGSIVNDAHLPAYKMASFEVAGIFDINIERAKMIAEKFAIPVVYESLEQLIQQAPGNAVFDMALPASAIISSASASAGAIIFSVETGVGTYGWPSS